MSWRPSSAKRSSPRSWGCFPKLKLTSSHESVFPTLVGVFLQDGVRLISHKRLPHARGGVSIWSTAAGRSVRSSPRSWGCFLAHLGQIPHGLVFPTLVGVFPGGGRAAQLPVGLPHARGGVSDENYDALLDNGSSPRSWGCFQPWHNASQPHGVFPTLVGVFPTLVPF